MRRVPIDSAAPVVVFAIARLTVSVASLMAVAILGFPYHGSAGGVLSVFVLWSVGVLVLSRREPERALHPAVPAVDFALLLALELAAPNTIVGVQLAALFLVAAHAHFQGEQLPGGAWIDTTVRAFAPAFLPVGDTGGVPQNLLEGLALVYGARDLGLATDAARARYTAVLRTTVAEFGRAHGFVEQRGAPAGAPGTRGSLMVAVGLVRMLEALAR